MVKATTRIPISDIILDEKIYPRDGVDQNVSAYLPKTSGMVLSLIRLRFKPILI